MLVKSGIPTEEDILKVTPPAQRLTKGPVAVIECFQKIPCNPCWEACHRGAIQEMEDMNNIPRIDFNKCNGCGNCAMVCPGLAIFIIDFCYNPQEALIGLPYEFLPLPEKNEMVLGLNRSGKEVGEFKVLKVQKGGGRNKKTPLIWLIVPRDLAMEVRNISYKGVKNHG